MNTHSISSRTRAAHYISDAILIILLALFLAPDAFAAKPDRVCKPHPKKPDNCGPAGQVMTPGAPTKAGLSGEFYEPGARNCVSEREPMDTRGNYECRATEKVAMGFRELGESVASRKRLSWMCNVLDINLDGIHLGLSMDSYIYGWTDSCSDGRCEVEIRLLSTDPILQTITFGRSDQVEITLFADATVPVDTQHPFNESRTLDIHSIETDFKKTGSTRSAVICHHDVLAAPKSVTFNTDPD
jgi:hypothetical protein